MILFLLFITIKITTLHND